MGPEWQTPEAASEPRAGGAYKVVMRTPAGVELQYDGRYLRINPPRGFEMTWPAYARPEVPTIVEVALDAISHATTEVVITHHGLPDERSRADHRIGWADILEVLGQVYGAGDDGGR